MTLGQRGLSAEDATPVQEGVMSETQEQHSRLFGGYKDITKGKTLHQLVLDKGDIQVGKSIGNVRLPSSFDISRFLERLSCEADVVLVGSVPASLQI